MAYGDFKDLLSRTAADRVLHNKTFNIDKNPKYDEYQTVQLPLFISFLIKRLQVVVLKIKIIQNKELNEELHKPIIRKIEKLKVHLSFIDTIWGVDLADM